MMKNMMRIAALGVALAAVGAEAAPQAFVRELSGVVKPKVKPVWSGAKPATWTMDLDAAFANAAKDGKYTLVYFAGMWWCPRCREFEKYVINTPAWKKFAKDRGLYLSVVDFPKRNGRDGWCWLWDASYRKSAKLTAEDSARRIVSQYALQDVLSDPSSTKERTAENFVVTVERNGRNVATNFVPLAEEPVSSYRSINYPGIVIFDPDGNEAGRFIPDTDENPDYTLEGALAYCMDQVDAAVNPSALDPWKGNWTLAFSQKGLSGVGSLALTVSAKGQVKISGFLPNGTKVSNTVPFVTGVKTCRVPVRFAKKDAEPAFTLVIDNATGKLSLESASGEYGLVGASAANLPPPGYVKCTVSGFPKEIGGCEVVAESVPTSFFMKGKRTTFSSDDGIRFTYTQKTGVFKGSFKVSVLRNGRPAKVQVSVNGVVIGDVAAGQALAKGASDTATVLLEPAEEPSGDDDCGECGL